MPNPNMPSNEPQPIIDSVPGMPARESSVQSKPGEVTRLDLSPAEADQKRAQAEANIALQNAAYDSSKRAAEAAQAQAQAHAERPLAPGAITEVPGVNKAE